ncbi:MAG: AAA family ATPase [Dehalococcoidales bacterium]|nr:AAA family ATPase [Dehalococcoidales bacterium]
MVDEQRVVIKHFGPIEDVDMDVKDIMLFIGPQAAGKSTISKSIYFFKSLKDDFIRYVLDAIELNKFDKSLGTFSKGIKGKFMEFWGSSFHMSGIFLQYFYGNGVEITIDLKQKYVNINYNQIFQNKFFEIVENAKIYANQISRSDQKKDIKFLSSSELLAIDTEKRAFLKKLQAQSNDLFNDDRDMIFVPAGRSLLATLSEQLKNLENIKLDYLMNSFIRRINATKNLFNKSFDDLIMDKKKLTQEKIESDYLNLAQNEIEEILKAKYQFDPDGEKLYFAKEEYVKLNYASSGQQESVWILLLIFLLILENRRIFIAIEEPEAHLFPEAQQRVVHLMSLLSNISKNQIVVTTHSPYILSSYNNLLYAQMIGRTKSEVNNIIDKHYWIDPQRIGAYFISNGLASPIIDPNSHLIKSDIIDSVSRSINDNFDKIFTLDE